MSVAAASQPAQQTRCRAALIVTPYGASGGRPAPQWKHDSAIVPSGRRVLRGLRRIVDHVRMAQREVHAEQAADNGARRERDEEPRPELAIPGQLGWTHGAGPRKRV